MYCTLHVYRSNLKGNIHWNETSFIYILSVRAPCIFQGLYLSEVVANLLQSCKLQCRASYTIMQNGTLSVKCSHATMNVRVPKHSLYTST